MVFLLFLNPFLQIDVSNDRVLVSMLNVCANQQQMQRTAEEPVFESQVVSAKINVVNLTSNNICAIEFSLVELCLYHKNNKHQTRAGQAIDSTMLFTGFAFFIINKICQNFKIRKLMHLGYL